MSKVPKNPPGSHGARSFSRSQRGAVAIIVGLVIMVMIGFLGIVLDLSNLYVRKSELQNAADAAALAGARHLNGTAGGIDAAVNGSSGTSATELAAANASDFGTNPVAITADHIRFGPTPDGPWSDAATAKVTPAAMSFIKVDTNGIAQGTRPTWFMGVLNATADSTTASGMAVAGATVCEGLPIFICAPITGNFTPGQTYFFGESPGYPIGPGNIGYYDPVPPGAPSLISGANDMRNILCAGKTFCLGSPGIYQSLTQSAFGTMARAINTRFDDFSSLPSGLTPEMCRPDTNVQEYQYSALTPAANPMAWMTPPPDQQSEQDTGATLGVHWSAVLPAGAALTGVAALPNEKYPATGSPYSQTSGQYYRAPSVASQPSAQSGRRIVTMAIASNCGAINGSGKPVVIQTFGRFFLPVKAVGTGAPEDRGIYVEFIDYVGVLQASAPDIKLFR